LISEHTTFSTVKNLTTLPLTTTRGIFFYTILVTLLIFTHDISLFWLSDLESSNRKATISFQLHFISTVYFLVHPQNIRFTKRQVYKTSGLQNVMFTKRQVFKTSGCKKHHKYSVLVVGGNPLVMLQPFLQAK
jgi:hypothetical protein